MAPQILVVEDDDFTRMSVVAALRSEGFGIAIETGTAGKAVTAAQSTPVDAAVLDLNLGTGPTGLDVARSLRRDSPHIGLVFLTSFDDPRMIDPASPIPSGAQYLTKESVTHPRMLTEAIRASLNSSRVALNRRSHNHLEGLTDVQLEVLRMIAQGLSNKQIASQRMSMEKSVEGLISRIAKALDVPAGPDHNQRVLLARAYYQAQGLGGLDE